MFMEGLCLHDAQRPFPSPSPSLPSTPTIILIPSELHLPLTLLQAGARLPRSSLSCSRAARAGPPTAASLPHGTCT